MYSNHFILSSIFEIQVDCLLFFFGAILVHFFLLTSFDIRSKNCPHPGSILLIFGLLCSSPMQDECQSGKRMFCNNLAASSAVLHSSKISRTRKPPLIPGSQSLATGMSTPLLSHAVSFAIKDTRNDLKDPGDSKCPKQIF